MGRILASRHFSRTTRLARLLRHVIEQTLAGCAGALKEYSIATAVFDKPETFDPRLDAIVRVQARAMRARLDAYYETEGREDDLVIRCFPGTYAPSFELRSPAPPAHPVTEFWNARLDALTDLLVP